MVPLIAVARTAALLWMRELAALFRVSCRGVLAGAGIVLLSALALGLLLAVIAGRAPAGPLPAEVAESMLRAVFSSSAVMSVLTVVVLALSLPARTSLQSLLDLLPVGRLVAQAGQLVPLLALAGVFGLSLSAMAFVLAYRLLATTGFVAACIFLLGNIVFLQMFALGGFLALSDLLRRAVRLPQQYATAISGIAVTAAAIVAFSRDLFTVSLTDDAWSPASLLPTRTAVAVISGHSPFEAAALVAAWLLAVGVFLASCRTHLGDHSVAAIKLVTGTRPPQGAFPASVWLEAITAIRTPQFIVTCLSAVPIVVAVRWLASFELTAPAAERLALGLPALPFVLGMYAVGRTMRFRWIGAVLGGSWAWWIAPKAVAHLLVGLVVAIPVYAVELTLGMVALGDAPMVMSRVALVLGAGILAGTLIPYSEEQGLSVTASGFLTATLVIGSSLVVAWVSSVTSSGMATLAELAIAVLLFATYALAAQAQENHASRYV